MAAVTRQAKVTLQKASNTEPFFTGWGQSKWWILLLINRNLPINISLLTERIKTHSTNSDPTRNYAHKFSFYHNSLVIPSRKKESLEFQGHTIHSSEIHREDFIKRQYLFLPTNSSFLLAMKRLPATANLLHFSSTQFFSVSPFSSLN